MFVSPSSYLCCKYCENELAGVEGVEDVGDDAEVGGRGDVGLEADVAELGLGRDVDGDVLPQTIVLLLLTIVVIDALISQSQYIEWLFSSLKSMIPDP